MSRLGFVLGNAVSHNPAATQGDDHVAALIWWGLGTVILAFGALFILEGYLFWTRQPKITDYIRAWSVGHWFIAVAVGVGLVAAASIAFTHFVFDAGNG